MNPVAELSSIQAEMEAKRAMPRCLVQGTEAMRAAGKLYLPQFPAELPEDYEARKKTTVLLPAYRDAIDLACGLIFRKEVTEGEGVPADAEEWLDDIDREGRDITQFAEAVLRDAFNGVSYIVADYPRVPVGSTLAQERALGARPYLVHIKCGQVLGWRTQRVNGKNILTQFRYMETTSEPNGPFGEKVVERVRVLEPGMVSVYIKDADGSEWVLDPEASGIVTLSEVPVVACYAGRTAFMAGEPPLLDLAHKNVQHWQADSDLQSVIHKTCVPLLVTIGADSGDAIVGPSSVMAVPMGGDAKWLELQGSSIPTAQANIDTIKAEMQAMAGKILDKGVVKTATQAGIESTQAMSRIQAWALGVQAALNQAWGLCGQWIGQELGTLAVNCDVDTTRPDAQFLTEIRNAVAGGLLTKETYLKILLDAEVLPEGFEVQTELDRLEAEAPLLPEIPARGKPAAKRATITRPDGSKSTVEME